MSRKLKQYKTVTLFLIYYFKAASFRHLFKSLLYSCRRCCIPYSEKDLEIQISFFLEKFQKTFAGKKAIILKTKGLIRTSLTTRRKQV